MEFVGEGPNRQSYVPVIARHFVAGRGWGELPNDPRKTDLFYLYSFPVERMSGHEMIGLAEWAMQTGRWSILTFHGINQGRLAVTDWDLRRLCQFLTKNRSQVWVAPVATIAQHLHAWRRQVNGQPVGSVTENARLQARG